MKMMNAWLFASALLLLVLSAASRANTNDKYSMNISISGTVVANGSCTFNQGGTLDVNFGVVKLQGGADNTLQLDGDYERPLTSDFSCTGDTAGLLQMKFTSAGGTYETYDGKQVLGMDKGIVGVELLLNGAAQNMGEWFTVDQKAMPSLQAKLVQISTTNSSNVTSGDTFSGSGTLTLAFN